MKLRYVLPGLAAGIALAAVGSALAQIGNIGGYNGLQELIHNGAAFTQTGAMKFNDDVEARFGTDIDYWLVYDNSNTQWEINSTNCDGAGADCVVALVNDGTDDVELVAGSLILDAAGQQIVFGVDNDPVTPSLQTSPGEGIFCPVDGRIGIAHGGAHTWSWDSTQLFSATSGGINISSAAASGTAPNVRPNGNDAGGNTGLGSAGEDILSLIAGGQEGLRITEGGVAAGETQLLFDACTFANLGTPSNGSLCYCSDCTIANPCAGSGTGAFAKRLNGAWVCN